MVICFANCNAKIRTSKSTTNSAISYLLHLGLVAGHLLGSPRHFLEGGVVTEVRHRILGAELIELFGDERLRLGNVAVPEQRDTIQYGKLFVDRRMPHFKSTQWASESEST